MVAINYIVMIEKLREMLGSDNIEMVKLGAIMLVSTLQSVKEGQEILKLISKGYTEWSTPDLHPNLYSLSRPLYAFVNGDIAICIHFTAISCLASDTIEGWIDKEVHYVDKETLPPQI
jgi:hypothetical protein